MEDPILDGADTNAWSITDSMIDTDEDSEDSEEPRDWDTLLGTENVQALRDWLAEQCPAYVALHKCHLDTGAWDNTAGKTHEERREKYEARVAASWKYLYKSCEKEFKDTGLCTAFLSVELREDEDDAHDVLEDFWSDVYETWMLVANGEAREMLKPLKNGLMIITMADIHRKVAMSPKIMTELASAVLQIKNPDMYAISQVIDDINDSNRRNEDDAMLWNFPAARDVLKHLVAYVKTKSVY
jgi:hypothetical protein